MVCRRRVRRFIEATYLDQKEFERNAMRSARIGLEVETLNEIPLFSIGLLFGYPLGD